MKTERLIGGELCANGYIVCDEGSLTGYVVDPGHGDPATMEYVRKYNFEFIEIMKEANGI